MRDGQNVWNAASFATRRYCADNNIRHLVEERHKIALDLRLPRGSSPCSFGPRGTAIQCGPSALPGAASQTAA